jgi:hypothetical protein
VQNLHGLSHLVQLGYAVSFFVPVHLPVGLFVAVSLLICCLWCVQREWSNCNRGLGGVGVVECQLNLQYCCALFEPRSRVVQGCRSCANMCAGSTMQHLLLLICVYVADCAVAWVRSVRCISWCLCSSQSILWLQLSYMHIGRRKMRWRSGAGFAQ